jgi:hypothetical protein
MKDYIRRSVKFIVYIAAIFVVFLVIVPLFVDGKPATESFQRLLNDQRFLTMMALLFAYGLVYPLIAFTKIKRHLNSSFAENREVFIKAFENLNYIKDSETKEQLVYRKKSHFARFTQWYEDRIVINTGDNPVTMSGMRKPLIRLDKSIDFLLSKSSE